MSVRRRFWDATVLAAAISASVAGITTVAASYIDYRRVSSLARNEASVAKCQAANDWLADEAVNAHIPAQELKRMTRDSLAVARACRGQR